MAINKVSLYVSQILEDLDNGLTWLKKDDLGYGSIQEKYNAKDQQINMIRKHPALKDAETSVTVFTVIDDTKDNNINERDTTINTTIEQKDANNLAEVSGDTTEIYGSDINIPEARDYRETVNASNHRALSDAVSADAFANL